MSLKIQYILSICIIVCSAFLIIMVAIAAADTQPFLLVDAIGLILLGIIPFVLSIIWRRKLRQQINKRKNATLEVTIIKYAQQCPEGFTVADVVVALHLPFEKAKRMVETMYDQDVLKMKMEEDAVSYTLNN